jgi:hypothetical protein
MPASGRCFSRLQVFRPAQCITRIAVVVPLRTATDRIDPGASLQVHRNALLRT